MVNRFLFLNAPGADRVVLLANAMPILLKEKGMASSQLQVGDMRFPGPVLLDCFGPATTRVCFDGSYVYWVEFDVKLD